MTLRSVKCAHGIHAALVLSACLFLASTLAANAQSGFPPLADFAGWQKTASSVVTRSGVGLPAVDAEIMKEFGLLSIEQATYKRSERTIHVDGLRFRDASGAYGAFTYYRQPGYSTFDIGQSQEVASSADTHILFTRGPWLIKVEMDQLTAMTASDMRELAAGISTSGSASNSFPSLPEYLQRAEQVPDSLRYVEGPAGWTAACKWLSAAGVGFQLGAEAVFADYELDQGQSTPAQFAVIAYPTPQIARTYLAKLQVQSTAAGFLLRRSGPMLILVHGAAGPSATRLLNAVNYDAEVTTDEQKPVGIEALPAMIIAIFVIILLLTCVAIVFGILSGGIYGLLRRFMPERFRKFEEEQTMIRLNL